MYFNVIPIGNFMHASFNKAFILELPKHLITIFCCKLLPKRMKIKKLAAKIRWKKYHIPIKTILILIIPLSIYLGATNYLLYDESFYHEEFTKVGSYERVPAANSILDSVLIFFKSGEPLLDETNFTSSEARHLYDVRNLIIDFTGALYLLIVFKLLLLGIIIFTSKKAVEDVIHITFGSGTLTIMIPLMFSSIDFNYLFTEFHNLFFPQGGWIFPESSLLIQLFPQQFFINFSSKIAYNSMFVGGFLISFSIALWFVTRKK